MRPRPTDFAELVESGRRGRLKVYMGSAPGVGKTCRLLDEARSLAARGVDVVLAAAEAHGRPETLARATGLEIVPARRTAFHGILAEELDVDAVLARRPQVAIVDDLAHTNLPGSRHGHRHQDVGALLAAGTSVITALDVAELESLRDLVERLTGLPVRETVPDTFVRAADQVVSLDLSDDDLLDRLHAGHIYPADRLAWATTHLFRREVLGALRELALREVAETLDAWQEGRSSPCRDPQVSGRVMVCLASLSPRALTLLRRGSRFVGRLATDWYVAYVETPQEAPHRIDETVRQRLLANVEQARALGAEVVWLRGRDPVDAILEFAGSHGVATLLIGRSSRSGWRRLFRRTIPERLIQRARGLDVYVIGEHDLPTGEARAGERRSPGDQP